MILGPRQLLATGFLSFLLLTVVGHASNPLIVRTDRGKVEGALTADGQVRAFKGIPFAAPPLGDLRWQPPQPAGRWTRARQAKDFGYHCIQSNSYNDMAFHDPGPSEDCLTLNVWAPAGAKPGSLPVMVWIYGGGFTSGGTSENRQDGQFLAHRNVIVVSMNYRLGIFGFFVHPELTAESPHHASGNYGLLDQAAALAWVKNNITAFGGNARNITLFGESAGSFSVSAQMASPVAKDLLAKAIGESGGAFASGDRGYEPRKRREVRDTSFAERAFGTSSLSALRKLPASILVAAATAKTMPAPPHFGPDIDGYFLPDSIPNIYAAGKQAQIPLLAGWNADESRGSVLLAKVKPTPASFASTAQNDFGGDAAKFLGVYPASTDAETLLSAGDFASDRFIAYSTWRWIEAQGKTGNAPTYRYLFQLGSPGDKNHQAILGAFHSGEIEYVFGTLDSRPEAVWRAEDRKLSDEMGQYWTNFARTGDPNRPGLPAWPTYNSGGSWQVMHLDASSEAGPDNHRERYLFLDGVWGKASQ